MRGETSMEDKSDFKPKEDYKAKLDALRRALIEGEESGFADYSLERIIADLDKENPA